MLDLFKLVKYPLLYLIKLNFPIPTTASKSFYNLSPYLGSTSILFTTWWSSSHNVYSDIQEGNTLFKFLVIYWQIAEL